MFVFSRKQTKRNIKKTNKYKIQKSGIIIAEKKKKMKDLERVG